MKRSPRYLKRIHAIMLVMAVLLVLLSLLGMRLMDRLEQPPLPSILQQGYTPPLAKAETEREKEAAIFYKEWIDYERSVIWDDSRTLTDETGYMLMLLIVCSLLLFDLAWIMRSVTKNRLHQGQSLKAIRIFAFSIILAALYALSTTRVPDLRQALALTTIHSPRILPPTAVTDPATTSEEAARERAESDIEEYFQYLISTEDYMERLQTMMTWCKYGSRFCLLIIIGGALYTIAASLSLDKRREVGCA